MLRWPDALKETEIRRQWFARISKLPAGLELPKAARMLREPYGAVRRWGVLFGYNFPDRRRAVDAEQWAEIDWSRRDADIARELGVTRECVRLVRRSRGMGPSAAQAATHDLSNFILAHVEELHGLPVEQVLGQSGSSLPYYVCRRLLREHGVRRYEPQSSGRDMDWRLPNRDLAALWGADARYIANLRGRLGVGPATWTARNRDLHRNGKYAAALVAERQRAKARQPKSSSSPKLRVPA